jgi:hypothetical protein
MSISYRLLVTDNVQRPKRPTPQPTDSVPGNYEREHGERQVSGSVRVDQAVRWLATLAVPMTGDQSLLITIERKGPMPMGAPTVDDLMLVIPPGEADVVVELLRGIVAHARQDGVLRA